jgi:hypothetical protein
MESATFRARPRASRKIFAAQPAARIGWSLTQSGSDSTYRRSQGEETKFLWPMRAEEAGTVQAKAR